MPINVGLVDRYLRIFVGLAMLAFAFKEGLPIQGWHWAGLIGIVPLATGFMRSCPLYTVLGLSTCATHQ